MPKMRAKSDLPSKTCEACQRPFAWRKKWEKTWNEVRFCSNSCRTGTREAARKDLRKMT
jgi:hypothetical protein